jgi:hypothetical protein
MTQIYSSYMIIQIYACCPQSTGQQQIIIKKSFKIVWRCHRLLRHKGHLSRDSPQSRLSANDKGDYKMIRWAEHRSSGIRSCASSHRLKWGPFLSNEVDRIAQHLQKSKEGNKVRMGIINPYEWMSKGRRVKRGRSEQIWTQGRPIVQII